MINKASLQCRCIFGQRTSVVLHEMCCCGCCHLGFLKQRKVGEREISTQGVVDRREEEEIKHGGSANYRSLIYNPDLRNQIRRLHCRLHQSLHWLHISGVRNRCTASSKQAERIGVLCVIVHACKVKTTKLTEIERVRKDEQTNRLAYGAFPLPFVTECFLSYQPSFIVLFPCKVTSSVDGHY